MLISNIIHNYRFKTYKASRIIVLLLFLILTLADVLFLYFKTFFLQFVLPYCCLGLFINYKPKKMFLFQVLSNSFCMSIKSVAFIFTLSLIPVIFGFRYESINSFEVIHIFVIRKSTNYACSGKSKRNV